MLRVKVNAAGIVCLVVVTCISAGCGNHNSVTPGVPSADTHDDDKILNFFNWADYVAPDTIESFEKLTGVKVHVSYFESEETLESRILTGNSGFDVVVTAGPYFQRQIRSGAYLPLDRRRLPNLANPFRRSRA